MSVVISGALTDGAGIPMSGCHIILKSRVNTSEVVMRTIADVVTGSNGEYSFEAQEGKYCVYLKQDWRDECCVGDIAVYDDAVPGTLNDFLTAPDEGDLKPDVVKRFEEMVAQAQQSEEAAAESERQAGQHAADAQKIKEDCQTLADNVQQNADAVTEDKKQVETLVSSAAQDAARAEQAKEDTDKIVNKAVDKLGEAATLAGEVNASAEAASKSEQNAKTYRDEAKRISDAMTVTEATTTRKGIVQLSSNTNSTSESFAATSKAVKSVMDEAKTKAPLDSPALTGTPTTPTPPDDATGLEMANAAFVRKLIAALVGSAPEALDTLNELAAALGDDPNFATTVTNLLAGKQPLNDTLSSLSALVADSNTLPYFSDKNVMDLANLTAVGLALIGQNSKDEVLSYLGVNPLSDELIALMTADGWYSSESSFNKYPKPGGITLAAYHGESAENSKPNAYPGMIIAGSRLSQIQIYSNKSETGSYSSTPTMNINYPGRGDFPGRYMALNGNLCPLSEKAQLLLVIRTA